MRRFGCLTILWLAAMASAAFAAPPTVDRPGEKFRFLSLAEARVIALEHVKAGQNCLLSPADPGVMLPASDKASSLGSVSVLASPKPKSKHIVLTGVGRGPRRAEYERLINQVLLNVENAYWNLYGAYWQLYSRERGLHFAYETWKICEAHEKEGAASRAAVAQAEGQYNLFRSQRLQTLDTVLDNERQLLAVLGLPSDDGVRLVPIGTPLEFFIAKTPNWQDAQFNWEDARRHAWKHRPELRLARQKAAWAIGNVAHAQEEAEEGVPQAAEVPQAQSRLQRARQELEDQKRKTESFLGLSYRRMSSAYAQFEATFAQRLAFATQLQIRSKLFRAGSKKPGANTPVALNLLLESQRFWVEALAAERQALATYNNARARWEYAKGDIMKYAHVRFGEEPPQGSEIIRAVERENKRTLRKVSHSHAGCKPRERRYFEGWPVFDERAESLLEAMDLPMLWTCCRPLKEVGDADKGLVRWEASAIFPPRRIHGGVSP